MTGGYMFSRKQLLVVFISYLIFQSIPVQSDSDVIPHKVIIPTGQFVEIMLPSKPTTGYHWVVRSLPPTVALESMQYEQNNDCLTGGMIGCGGYTKLRLLGIKPGNDILKLQYSRLWETLPDTTKNIQVHVK